MPSLDPIEEPLAPIPGAGAFWGEADINQQTTPLNRSKMILNGHFGWRLLRTGPRTLKPTNDKPSLKNISIESGAPVAVL
jgi:hypothetical protein